jgi:hypothetical protein
MVRKGELLMTKSEAHAILDQLRSGKAMSVALTTQALLVTGDIAGFFGESLRPNSDEQRNDRPCALHDTPIPSNFSYSKYLNCPTNEGVTQ